MAITNEFSIYKSSETFRLHKEMPFDEVKNLLEDDYVVEFCPDKNDLKRGYNFPEGNGTHKLLFRQYKQELAMKGPRFINSQLKKISMRLRKKLD